MIVPTTEDEEKVQWFIIAAKRVLDQMFKEFDTSPCRDVMQIAELLQRQSHHRLNAEMEERQMSTINKEIRK